MTENSVEPDEKLHFAASHLGLHCLLKSVERTLVMNGLNFAR